MAETVTAGKAKLRVLTEGFDSETLRKVLSKIAENPVELDGNVITVEDEDLDKIQVMLGEVGIETQVDGGEGEESSTAAAASEHQEGEEHGEGEEEEGESEEGEHVAGSEEEEESEEEESVSEDKVYSAAEKQINLAASFQGVPSATDKSASWTILADGWPVAKINLDDIDNASQIASYFKTDDYFNMIEASFQKNGVAETLKALNAEVFLNKPVRPSQQIDVRAVREEAIEEYSECLSMAVAAAQKNIIENPLKGAAYDVLAGKMDGDPIEAIEEIFASFDEFFKSLDLKAREYLEEDESGRRATAKLLASMGVQSVTGRVAESSSANQMKAALRKGNMSIVPQTQETVEASSDHESGFRNRVRAGLTPRY